MTKGLPDKYNPELDNSLQEALRRAGLVHEEGEEPVVKTEEISDTRLIPKSLLKRIKVLVEGSDARIVDDNKSLDWPMLKTLYESLKRERDSGIAISDTDLEEIKQTILDFESEIDKNLPVKLLEIQAKYHDLLRHMRVVISDTKVAVWLADLEHYIEAAKVRIRQYGADDNFDLILKQARETIEKCEQRLDTLNQKATEEQSPAEPLRKESRMYDNNMENSPVNGTENTHEDSADEDLKTLNQIGDRFDDVVSIPVETAGSSNIDNFSLSPGSEVMRSKVLPSIMEFKVEKDKDLSVALVDIKEQVERITADVERLLGEVGGSDIEPILSEMAEDTLSLAEDIQSEVSQLRALSSKTDEYLQKLEALLILVHEFDHRKLIMEDTARNYKIYKQVEAGSLSAFQNGLNKWNGLDTIRNDVNNVLHYAGVEVDPEFKTLREKAFDEIARLVKEKVALKAESQTDKAEFKAKLEAVDKDIEEQYQVLISLAKERIEGKTPDFTIKLPSIEVTNKTKPEVGVFAAEQLRIESDQLAPVTVERINNLIARLKELGFEIEQLPEMLKIREVLSKVEELNEPDANIRARKVEIYEKSLVRLLETMETKLENLKLEAEKSKGGQEKSSEIADIEHEIDNQVKRYESLSWSLTQLGQLDKYESELSEIDRLLEDIRGLENEADLTKKKNGLYTAKENLVGILNSIENNLAVLDSNEGGEKAQKGDPNNPDTWRLEPMDQPAKAGANTNTELGAGTAAEALALQTEEGVIAAYRTLYGRMGHPVAGLDEAGQQKLESARLLLREYDAINSRNLSEDEMAAQKKKIREQLNQLAGGGWLAEVAKRGIDAGEAKVDTMDIKARAVREYLSGSHDSPMEMIERPKMRMKRLNKELEAALSRHYKELSMRRKIGDAFRAYGGKGDKLPDEILALQMQYDLAAEEYKRQLTEKLDFRAKRVIGSKLTGENQNVVAAFDRKLVQNPFKQQQKTITKATEEREAASSLGRLMSKVKENKRAMRLLGFGLAAGFGAAGGALVGAGVGVVRFGASVVLGGAAAEAVYRSRQKLVADSEEQLKKTLLNVDGSSVSERRKALRFALAQAEKQKARQKAHAVGAALLVGGTTNAAFALTDVPSLSRPEISEHAPTSDASVYEQAGDTPFNVAPGHDTGVSGFPFGENTQLQSDGLESVPESLSNTEGNLESVGDPYADRVMDEAAVYTIKPGDSIWKIAEANSTEDLSSLAEADKNTALMELRARINESPELRAALGLRSDNADLIYAGDSLNVSVLKDELAKILAEQAGELKPATGQLPVVGGEVGDGRLPIYVEGGEPFGPGVRGVTDDPYYNSGEGMDGAGGLEREPAADTPPPEPAVKETGLPPSVKSFSNPAYQDYINKTYGSVENFNKIVATEAAEFEKATYSSIGRFFGVEDYKSSFAKFGDYTVEEIDSIRSGNPNKEIFVQHEDLTWPQGALGDNALREYALRNGLKVETMEAWFKQIDAMKEALPHDENTTLKDLFARFVAENRAYAAASNLVNK